MVGMEQLLLLFTNKVTNTWLLYVAAAWLFVAAAAADNRVDSVPGATCRSACVHRSSFVNFCFCISFYVVLILLSVRKFGLYLL